MKTYQESVNGRDTYVFRTEGIEDLRAAMDAIPLTDLLDDNRTNIEDKYGQFSQEVLHNKQHGWYGAPAKVDVAEMASRGITQFIDSQMLNNLQASVASLIPTSVTSKFKKRKFKFNRNFGSFSFDRASAGLFWLDEFYCESEGRAVHVSETMIEPVQNNPRRIMHLKPNMPVQPVTEIKAEHFAEFPNSPLPIVGRKEARADGTPFVRTNVEDVFVYFPHVPKTDNSVLLCVNIGGGGDKTWQEMAYSGLAAGILADLFARIGVKVAIHAFLGTQNCMNGSATTGGSRAKHRFSSTKAPYDSNILPVIPIKTFKDTLDVNAIAVFADSRFIRYENYRNRFKFADILGRNCKTSLGNFWSSGSRELDDNTNYFSYDKELADAKRIHIQPMGSEREVVRFVTQIAQMVHTP